MTITEIENDFKEKFPMLANEETGVLSWIRKMVYESYLDGIGYGMESNKCHCGEKKYYLKINKDPDWYVLRIYSKRGQITTIAGFFYKKENALRIAKKISKDTGWEIR